MSETIITPEIINTIPPHAMKEFKRRFPRSYQQVVARVPKPKQRRTFLDAKPRPRIEVNITPEDLITKFIDTKPHSIIRNNCGLLTDVSWLEVVSERRARRIIVVRHVVMYLLHEYSGWSLPRIGRFLGNRDHSTVWHGIRSVRAWLAMSHKDRAKSNKNYGPVLHALEPLLKQGLK